MSKAKPASTTTEFVPPSAATRDPAPPVPAASDREIDREIDELAVRIQSTVFGICDFLGWPRDLEGFAVRIKEHPLIQDFIPHADDPILTLQAAGDLVGRSGQTIRNWISEGYIESELDPSGLRRVRRSKLLRFFQGTALSRPFAANAMSDEQRAQYDVDVQLRYTTIYCKFCQKEVIKNTDRPAIWLAAHSQTCNAETYADANRPN